MAVTLTYIPTPQTPMNSTARGAAVGRTADERNRSAAVAPGDLRGLSLRAASVWPARDSRDLERTPGERSRCREIKREVAELRTRAIDSLVLGIELFNRPHERGRAEAVLILLHHAFEMLLKAIIKDRTGTVHAEGDKYTYGFDKCLDVMQNPLRMISADERMALSILDGLRDTSVHYFQVMSEDLLYIQAQAATTLFDAILHRGFGASLADFIPSRVLPISSKPPKDVRLLIGSELQQIDELLVKGSRRGAIAAARLRPLLTITSASRTDGERVSENDVREAVRRRRNGDEWTVVLPDVAQLRLDTTGEGSALYLRIKKDAAIGVRIAGDGKLVSGYLVKQEINIWDKYNLGRDDLAEKVGLSGPRTSAVIMELGIQEDAECFKTLRRKKSVFKGYSKKALDRITDALASGLDVEAAWSRHRHRFGSHRRQAAAP